MATLRGAQGRQGTTPWGWIIGLIVVAVLTAAIIWWMRAGAPPIGTSGQEGVEQRSAPGTDQPGAQPPAGGGPQPPAGGGPQQP
jgi:hypothetical protein